MPIHNGQWTTERDNLQLIFVNRVLIRGSNSVHSVFVYESERENGKTSMRCQLIKRIEIGWTTSFNGLIEERNRI